MQIIGAFTYYYLHASYQNKSNYVTYFIFNWEFDVIRRRKALCDRQL